MGKLKTKLRNNATIRKRVGYSVPNRNMISKDAIAKLMVRLFKDFLKSLFRRR